MLPDRIVFLIVLPKLVQFDGVFVTHVYISAMSNINLYIYLYNRYEH